MNPDKLAKEFLADAQKSGVRYYAVIEGKKKNASRKVRRSPSEAEQGLSTNDLNAAIRAWLAVKGIAVSGADQKTLQQAVDNGMPKLSVTSSRGPASRYVPVLDA